MRLVLDTAAMVAALRSDSGASRKLLVAALERKGLVLLVSVPLLIEYEAVMTRPEHLRAANVSAAEVSVLLDAVAAVCEPVVSDFLWRPVAADPDDDMVLETAVNGNADAIATFNIRDLSAAARRFGITVCAPGRALMLWEKNA